MNLEEIKKVWIDTKKQPIRTVSFLLLLFILVFVGHYLTGYFNEKGRTAASSSSKIAPQQVPTIILENVESFNNGGAGVRIEGNSDIKVDGLKTYGNTDGGLVVER